MGKLQQAHTTLSSSLGNMLMAIQYVWPSYTLRLYTAKDTIYLNAPMNEIESSLVGSLPSLGAMFGTLIIGWFNSAFGRKKSAVILAVLMMISWLMVGLSKSSVVILIARFFCGIAGGFFLGHAPIYVSEVAEESIRGVLAATPMIFYCIGVLVSYLLGWFFTYNFIIWSNVIFSVIYAVLMMTVTESPVYLLRNNRDEEARLAIAHYRGGSVTSKNVNEEFSRLKKQVMPAIELLAMDLDLAEKEKLNLEANEIEEQSSNKISSFKMLVVSPSSRRAFTVVGLALSLQVCMGMVAVQVYAKDIFTRAAPQLSSHFCSAMFAFVLLAGSLSSGIFSDRCGRRILFLSSTIATGLCLASMGFIIQTNIAPAWVTAPLILFYCFSFMFGAGSVPYILLAEAFIPEVQSFASIILLELVWLLNFVIVGVFPFMVKFFGIHGSFYCFAIFAFADCLFGFFLLPETKGLTNEQIQQAFLSRQKK